MAVQYDVIVVGAGSAGAVIAARLSEDPEQSVLLLEAGPDYADEPQLPDDLRQGNSSGLAAAGPHTWGYTAIANAHQTQPFMLPRGRVTGGSSAINGTIFLRGTPEDYDNWAAWGNPEWSYDKVLPYFRKMERDLDFDGDFHGTQGPLPIKRFTRQTLLPIQEAFYRACEAEGYPFDPDMNAPQSSGLGFWPKNNIDGLRMSTALTYLNSARHRLNLTIRANVTAHRVLFDGKRATGVEAESNGERFRARANTVVVSCGAIASPQLLMLSGLGPADHLRQFNISVVHDLPGVGSNLRDHPLAIALFHAREGILDALAPSNQVGLRFTAEGSDTRNDLYIIPISVASPYGSAGIEHENNMIGTGIGIALENASTAGEIRLTSANPHVQPHIDFRYLSNTWDLERMRQGLRLIIRLSEHPAYAALITERLTPTDADLISDDTIDAWLLTHAKTQHHSSGTCKMGPASDRMAVVDQYCRVHGVEGLRVVDASIMPDVVRANTNATAIMLGERVMEWL